MRRGRFAGDWIIGVLREYEAGVKTAELCRKHGIGDATFYNWKPVAGHRTHIGGDRRRECRRSHAARRTNR
jgi:putative transposase